MVISGAALHFETFYPPVDKHLMISAVSLGHGRFATITTDVTERHRAEEQVRKLLEESTQARQALLGILEDQMRAEADRKRLATAIAQAAETIVVTDVQGTIQYVNPAFESVTGYTRAEVLGQNPRILQSGQHDVAFYRQLWQTLLAGQTWRGRFVNKRKDGALYTENAVISPVSGDSGQIAHFVAVKHDVTEQLRLAEQLQQAQKLESIGRLAGGVAHDFNNMLQIILGSTEIAQLQTDLASPLQNELRDIQDASLRSIEIVQQLLAFARKQTVAPVVLDLNETTRGFLRMLQRLIGESIGLAWVPGTGVWPIKMDPVQINQILANLCVNARDAIAGHGQITIATENAAVAPERPSGHPPHATGDFVRLTVRDNGCGMDAQTLAHIYDPFFTTKGVGKGTGLGLSTVYGIVDQNGGFIEVESAPGQGTVFQVFLPRCSDGPGSALPASSAQDSAGGTETVLVVEDEPAVLKQTIRFLERCGYRALAADSPEMALRLVQEHPDQVQLLVTDVVMPGMNGTDLARTLRKRQPGLRCLFMSGYSADLVAQGDDLVDGANLIWKPFTQESLATHVRNVLDS